MATTRGQDAEAPEPTKSEQAERAVRTVVAGNPQAQMRRILLYATMFVFMGLGFWISPLLVVSLTAGCFLLATDGDL